MAPFGPWPGEGGAKFLVEIYNNGLTDPTHNNLFDMLHGTTMRFQSSTALPADELPYIATYDASAGTAYSVTGLPAIGWSLATINGGFGRLFNGYQLFDEGWDGTFAHIGNQGAFEVEALNYEQTPLTHWDRVGLLLGTRYYRNAMFWPEGDYPQPDVGATGAEVHELNLYNTSAGGLWFVEATDGFGQTRYGFNPPLHGIVWQWATHFVSQVGTQVGDGTGWAIMESQIDHPHQNLRGALACSATDLLGNWQWDVQVSDGAGGLTSVATFTKSLITFRAPVVSDGLTATGETALLDLTAVAANIPITIPKRPGYYFNPISAKVIITDVTGVATAGTLGVHYGNDAGQSNGSATNLTPATINALAGSLPAGVTIGTGATSMRDSSAFPFFAAIASVLTGVTAAHGRIVVVGNWVPV